MDSLIKHKNILFLAVNLILLLIYIFQSINCEPCLNVHDCPPCLSELQTNIIYILLTINISFLILVIRDTYIKRNK